MAILKIKSIKCVAYLCLLVSLIIVISVISPYLAGNYSIVLVLASLSNKAANIQLLATPTTSLLCNISYSDVLYTVDRRLTRLDTNIKASCKLLGAGNRTEAARVRRLQNTWYTTTTDDDYLQIIANCDKIVPTFNKNFYSSNKEMDYPLGFVILVTYMEHSVQQYIRLLRFIYRPQNVYCIHIDTKCPTKWIESVTTFASCFPNILIAKDAIDVIYAHASILTAHLNCWKELSYTSLPWKYLIDLHGTELPMMTNREMVETLEPLKGINAIKSGVTINDALDPHSIIYRKFTNKATYFPGVGMKLTDEMLGPVPFNLTLYKSADSPNSAFSRQFVHFVLTDFRAIALYDYLQDVLSAVEFFFNTLNNLPDAPGGTLDYNMKTRDDENFPMPNIVVRHWDTNKQLTNNQCEEGRYRHRICLISSSDFYWLRDASLKNRYFFINKYLMDYDHVVMDCMEELLLERNLREYENDCVT